MVKNNIKDMHEASTGRPFPILTTAFYVTFLFILVGSLILMGFMPSEIVRKL